MSKIDELLKKVASDLDIENSKIKATVSRTGQNIINIKIELLEDNIAKKQTEKFEEYVNTLPDDLFMATLEILGQDEVKRIDKCIHSNDLESVRGGIIKFKQALAKVIETKLAELKQILPSCR
jgi:hypothetical protein